MNRKIPFGKNELTTIEMVQYRQDRPPIALRDYPVSAKENMAAMFYDKHPYWTPVPVDFGRMSSQMYSDRLGRGGPDGTTDVFGITWEYIATAGGSIVRPGEPFMADVNEWKEKITFPDLDSWDWASEAAAVKLDSRFSTQMSFWNGFWFERLVSLMDFGPAVLALIDEDQIDAVKELFAAMTDFGCKLIDKFCEYWPQLDGFNIHDDWGAQKAPFFSQDVGLELFVPYMRALTDHIHSKGRYVTLHSCGHNFSRIQCFIDGGFDQWEPQPMNDTQTLYDAFGDKIILSVIPNRFDPETTSEEDQRLCARDFVDRFCKPGKPSMLSNNASPMLTPAFLDEVYRCSRIKYAGL